jgi:hypothetical protein
MVDLVMLELAAFVRATTAGERVVCTRDAE